MAFASGDETVGLRRGGVDDDRHPLLNEYYMRRGRPQNAETVSIFSAFEWTNWDEIKRCSVAVATFVFVAVFSGTLLIGFWFVWAWFVLWLNLPGILTPIIWLCGFVAPLCMVRAVASTCWLFQSGTVASVLCCKDKALRAPNCNSWKAYHLWAERKKHVTTVHSCICQQTAALIADNQIMDEDIFEDDEEEIDDENYEEIDTSAKSGLKANAKWRALQKKLARAQMCEALPWTMHLSEVISDYCFHNDMLVTVRGKQLVGMYPDSADIHTLLEFDRPLTEVCVPNGDISKAFALVTKARSTGMDQATGGWLPSWLRCDDRGFVDCMVCEYDLAKGQMISESEVLSFSYLKCGYLAELKGVEYRPSMRLLASDDGSRVICHLDGDFVVLQKRSGGDGRLRVACRRELIAGAMDVDDREQLVHLREYKWHSAAVVPDKVCRAIIRVVDTVENTNAQVYMCDRVDDEAFVIVPFGEHALFVGNIMTGWLRYLDFGGVDAIRESEINHVAFSRDCDSHFYLCLNEALALVSVHNFQPLLVVPFAQPMGFGYTIPCGMVTMPPEGVQISAMRGYYEMHARRPAQDLADKLESVALVYTSSRVLVDPRCYLYRFPRNKSRTITLGSKRSKGRRKKLCDSKWLLNRYGNNRILVNPTAANPDGQGDSEDPTCVLLGAGGAWQYLSLSSRPWRFRTDTLRVQAEVPRTAVLKAKDGGVEKMANNSKKTWSVKRNTIGLKSLRRLFGRSSKRKTVDSECEGLLEEESGAEEGTSGKRAGDTSAVAGENGSGQSQSEEDIDAEARNEAEEEEVVVGAETGRDGESAFIDDYVIPMLGRI